MGSAQALRQPLSFLCLSQPFPTLFKLRDCVFLIPAKDSEESDTTLLRGVKYRWVTILYAER